MRRLVALGVALFVVTAPAASGAGKDRAMIEGRILMGDTNRPVPGARVTVLGARLDGQGEVVRKTIPADESGRFSFAVPDREGLEFALEAAYDGGLFVGDSFPMKDSTTESTLRVWPTTSDPGVITITRDHMFVAPGDGGAGVLESVTVNNESDRAYIGRGQALGAGGSGPSPTLGFALPTQSLGQRVDLIDSSLNRLYAVDADFGFAATVAIPPGETSVTFAYGSRGAVGRHDLTRQTLYPTQELSVFAVDPFEISSNRLTYAGIEDVGDERYGEWSSQGGFDAGDVVSIVAVAEGSSSSNLWLVTGIVFAVITLLMASGLLLRSRSRRAPPERHAPAVGTQPQEGAGGLVAAIARLDLEHESGSITEEQWRARRTELKSRLLADKQRESTP